MPHLNLSPNDLAEVKAILKQHVPEREVWAYGSRVNGKGHDASDLDLVIRNPSELQNPIENLAELKQAFIDSNLPFLVDLMDWSGLPLHFREEIKKRHVLVGLQK